MCPTVGDKSFSARFAELIRGKQIVMRTKHLANQNPYLPPTTSGAEFETKSSESVIRIFVCAVLNCCIGFTLTSAFVSFWARQPVFSFLGVFTATAVILAFAGAYLLVRRAGVLTVFAVFGSTALLLLLVRNPNYESAAKLVAVQSSIQMSLTVVFSFLARPIRGSRISA